MDDPVELMLADLTAKYAETSSSGMYARLYTQDNRFGHIFAMLHQGLNGHFESINGRSTSTKHYWAESSRDLLDLITEVSEALDVLKIAGLEVTLHSAYKSAIEGCQSWLSSSGGSAIPEKFEPIRLIKYEPIFSRPDTVVRLKKALAAVPLTMIGEGSYATVYSFTDPDYGIKFALKRAKKHLDQRDLTRFQTEFNVLKRLSYPYIVDVYQYNDERNEYKMEYCDETLRQYIARRNAFLAFDSRKRIALQFLYGMNYLHLNDLLHRDVSLQNVMLKVYERGAVLVKLSDFGFVKDLDRKFTRTHTEMRGTIRDPMLVNFGDYKVINEIYSIGWVLSFIFTGKESLIYTGRAGQIVRNCTAGDPHQRYQQTIDVIRDVERLEVGTEQQ